MFDRKLFGSKVRYYRKKKGMSIENLAEKANLSPNYVSTLENGKSTPTLETIFKIRSVLDTSYGELIDNQYGDEFELEYILSRSNQLSTRDHDLLKFIIQAILAGDKTDAKL